MAGNTPKAKPSGTGKMVISAALADAETRLTRAVPGGFKRLGKGGRSSAEETLLEVAKGTHADVGQLIRGPRRLGALQPPIGSRLPLEEEVLSPDALAAISRKVEPLLASRTSKAYPGRDQLTLLGERFGMTTDDLAFLIENKQRFAPSETASRAGQTSDVGGRTFERRLIENNPLTRERERVAAEAEIRTMLGDQSFKYTPGAMGQVAIPRRRADARNVQAMFETLTEEGFDRAAPGIWVKRLGAVADDEGELTDGVTIVADMRNPATANVMFTGLRPSNVDKFVKKLALPSGTKRPKVVGLRESKFQSVVGDLTEQVPKDFERLLDGVVIQGRSLSGGNVKTELSEHLVVSLLTEKRKVSPSAMKEIQDGFEEWTGAQMKKAVEIDNADRDAQLAREIAQTALDSGDDKLVKKATDKLATSASKPSK